MLNAPENAEEKYYKRSEPRNADIKLELLSRK